MGKLWRQIRVRPRLVTSAVAGASVWLIVPAGHAASTRALIAWDIGSVLYIALAWFMMARASIEHMRWRARMQDDGATAVLLLTVSAGVASLAAIVLELSGSGALPAAQRGLHLGLVALTFAASWTTIHTSFALHYAHDYYARAGTGDEPPLEFLRQTHPVYWDFLYFALVIGMTSQTADVAIAQTRMRRLVMLHGLVAFVFNTTLLALTVNIAASLVG